MSNENDILQLSNQLVQKLNLTSQNKKFLNLNKSKTARAKARETLMASSIIKLSHNHYIHDPTNSLHLPTPYHHQLLTIFMANNQSSPPPPSPSINNHEPIKTYELTACSISYAKPTAPFPMLFNKPCEPFHAQPTYILHDVSFTARPAEVLAIVGPSGAGKSTLLEILAGKLAPHTTAASTAAVLVNRKPISKPHFKKVCGYVMQRDLLFPLLTVRETLMFSARLRLGRHQGALPSLSSRVDSLILELGLGHVAGTRVGASDGKIRGISGGERRRVSIGVEAVHDPRILILDEPTSGLDSTSALQIVDMLKAMAEGQGRTVILSIHQPGFRIVKLFNSVLVLAEGAVVHQGSVDQLQMHLRSVGLEVPAQVNVLEFAIDSIETLQQQQRQRRRQQKRCELLEDDRERVSRISRDGKRDRCTLQQLFQQINKVVDEETVIMSSSVALDLSYDYANSRFAETAILAQRFLKNVFRTRELFACRTIQMLVSGLVLGSIFFNLKDDRSGAGERVGLFAFILTFLLSCTTEALPIFLQEREILMKETSSGTYRISSYVIANGLVFLPFLLILSILFSTPVYWLVGLHPCLNSFIFFVLLIWLILYTANSVVVCFSALVPNFIVGNSVISGVMGSFFLFSGYFISKESMPRYWVFMHYISLFKYPFEGLVVNEFGGKDRCVEYSMGVCLLDGDSLLREEGLGEERRWRDVVVMLGFILGFRFMSYVILRVRCELDQKGGGHKRAQVP